MANNIEIKARVPNFASLMQTVKAIAGKESEQIYQRDTFFNATTGRLKLREFKDGSAVLISYLRENTLEPVSSDYLLYPAHDPELLRDTLSKTLGIRGEVRKTRHLFMTGRTRIHLDVVDSLGHFMELEVVLESGEDPQIGEREATLLMRKLGIEEDDLIKCAYIDLICDYKSQSSS